MDTLVAPSSSVSSRDDLHHRRRGADGRRRGRTKGSTVTITPASNRGREPHRAAGTDRRATGARTPWASSRAATRQAHEGRQHRPDGLDRCSAHRPEPSTTATVRRTRPRRRLNYDDALNVAPRGRRRRTPSAATAFTRRVEHHGLARRGPPTTVRPRRASTRRSSRTPTATRRSRGVRRATCLSVDPRRTGRRRRAGTCRSPRANRSRSRHGRARTRSRRRWGSSTSSSRQAGQRARGDGRPRARGNGDPGCSTAGRPTRSPGSRPATATTIALPYGTWTFSGRPSLRSARLGRDTPVIRRRARRAERQRDAVRQGAARPADGAGTVMTRLHSLDRRPS